MAMRREEVVAGNVPEGVAATDATMSRQLPLIFEYLTCARWDDGGERQTATLMVLAEQGTWKGCLNDRDGSRSCWVAADTFTGVLEALERALRNGTADWRVRPPESGRRRKN